MKTLDLLRLAAIGLWRKRSRTFLTVLGVIIGTACIVLMFAIGLSNYNQFNENITQNQSLTEITINHYSNSQLSGGGITDSTISSIKNIEGVAAVSPVITMPVTIKSGKYTANMQLMGVDGKLITEKYKEGKPYQPNGSVASLVLGSEATKQFMQEDNPVNYWEVQDYTPDIDWLNANMTLELGYPQMEDMPSSTVYMASVSGILDTTQQSQNAYSSYIDLEVAKRMIMENRELAEKLGLKLGSYSTAIIQADSIDNVQNVLAEVKKLGFETYSPTEWITQMQEEQGRQQGQLFAIGFISLFVSAIGIANTMYASILERRRDIGVMKVVGMKIRKIRRLFLVESAFIGLIGGLIGIGISYIIALAINTGTGQTTFLGMYFNEGMKVEIPFWLSLGAVGIAIAVGILSGIYPASKATKLSPLEAMRSGK
ncbi:MAG: ABC transporter permease [Christensenellaceae bacterium]